MFKNVIITVNHYRHRDHELYVHAFQAVHDTRTCSHSPTHTLFDMRFLHPFQTDLSTIENRYLRCHTLRDMCACVDRPQRSVLQMHARILHPRNISLHMNVYLVVGCTLCGAFTQASLVRTKLSVTFLADPLQHAKVYVTWASVSMTHRTICMMCTHFLCPFQIVFDISAFC